MKFVVAVLEDLFFTVKISDAARRAGLTVAFTKDPDVALARVQQDSAIVVIDLNRTNPDPVALIARIKQTVPATPVIGFVSHVQVDVKKAAEQAGCDVVLARSAFSDQLPKLLQQYSE